MSEQLGLILLMNGAVLIVPGLNFTMLTRYALQNGLKAALYCTAGITFAIAIHVLFAMFGSWQIITSYPAIFVGIQLSGACYITYLGSQMLLNSFKSNIGLSLDKQAKGSPILSGFMVDLLNPFVTIFYFSLFAQIMKNEVTVGQMLMDWLFILLITFVWFSLVSICFSRQMIRTRFLHFRCWIERTSAILLFYYSYQLLSASQRIS